jgi:hypothetical protein
VKPDLLALGLTVAAVMALDRQRPAYMLAGALIALAAMTKPTALLPALALLMFVARRHPLDAFRAFLGGLGAAVVAAYLTHGFDKSVLLHVFTWNALPWRAELAAPLVLLALLVLVVPITAIVVTRPSTTVVTAYAAGAVGILLLGGREGATINYFLDLSAAIALALAGRAPVLARGALYPIAAVAQAAVAVLLLNPFGVVPFRPVGAGAWGDPERIGAVGRIPGMLLVEDSGLLVASDREPIVDDIFLWSRNRERELTTRTSYLEGERLLRAVREGRFDAVVSEADLDRVGETGGFEAQRWHPDLVAAVRDRYVFRERVVPATAGTARGPLYVYGRR